VIIDANHHGELSYELIVHLCPDTPFFADLIPLINRHCAGAQKLAEKEGNLS
jgi:hypothetical protein